MIHDPGLLTRLTDFRFDDPAAAFPFSARLARDQQWSRAFALRVVEEYRRFLYLACTAGHEVTPSVDVDAAWHLHLVYTRSYWDELCERTLHRRLHHAPTAGGPSEEARFRAAYRKTLAAYEKAFGAAPPSDIWPDVEKRFAPVRRADRARRAAGWLAGGLMFGGATTAIAATSREREYRSAVGLLIIAGFATAFVVWIRRRLQDLNGQGGKSDRSSGSGCGGGFDSNSHHASGHDGGGDSGGSGDGGGGCGSGCGGGD